MTDNRDCGDECDCAGKEPYPTSGEDRVREIAGRIAVERKEAFDLLAPFDGPVDES